MTHTTDRAAAFLAFLQDRVWYSTSSAPALIGNPRTALLEPATTDP